MTVQFHWPASIRHEVLAALGIRALTVHDVFDVLKIHLPVRPELDFDCSCRQCQEDLGGLRVEGDLDLLPVTATEPARYCFGRPRPAVSPDFDAEFRVTRRQGVPVGLNMR